LRHSAFQFDQAKPIRIRAQTLIFRNRRSKESDATKAPAMKGVLLETGRARNPFPRRPYLRPLHGEPGAAFKTFDRAEIDTEAAAKIRWPRSVTSRADMDRVSISADVPHGGPVKAHG
jgi:hypothetical protein